MYRKYRDERIVHLTPSAGLRGQQVRAADNVYDCGDCTPRDIYVFLGIPYAEPPTGNLRFQDPRPLTLWNGIRDATEFGAACPQNMALQVFLPFKPKEPKVSEDCLFLNVYTPSVDPTSKLPVIFWIHGGAFVSGFSNLYAGHTLAATKDVVVVTINYRLGPFGFLCTNDSAATGNYGILDQIEALKWVQKYIVNFGGNPDNVSIFGESAGGMSVSLLVMSPLTRGLFRRAIADSGCVFAGEMITCPPQKAASNLRTALAKKIPGGISDTASGAEIVNYLRCLTADELLTLDDVGNAVVDGRVLPKNPMDIYESAAHNHVELLIGSNSDEGMMIFAGIGAKFGMTPSQLNLATAQMLLTGVMAPLLTDSTLKPVTDATFNEYFDHLDSTASSDDVYKVVVELLSDLLFLVPAVRTADYHSRTSKTFMYYFCNRPAFAQFPPWASADHATELFYLLDFPDSTLQMSAQDWEFSHLMKSYWVNFAKTGDPNGEGLPRWPEYNEETKRHLILKNPVQPGERLKEQRVNFWLHQVPQLMAQSL